MLRGPDPNRHLRRSRPSPEKAGDEKAKRISRADRTALKEIWRIPIFGRFFASEEGELQSSRLKRAISALVLLAIICVPLGLVFLVKQFRQERGIDPEKLAQLRLYRAPDKEVYQKVLDDYLKARSIEERMKCIRAPFQVKPKMVEWYAKHGEGPVERYEVEGSALRVLHGKSFVILDVNVRPANRLRTLVLERLSDEDYKVDWEIASEYQPLNWADFRATKPKAPQAFRVALRPGDFYNWSFQEKADECWEITHPGDKDLLLFGYVPRDSEISRKLHSLREREFLDATVELSYPENPRDDTQVRLSKIVSPSWIMAYPESLAER